MNTIKNCKITAILSLIFACCLALTCTNSYSDSSSTNIMVSATVSSNCRINTDIIQFGTYDPINANAASGASAVSKLDIKCTRGTNAVISIDSGSNQGRTSKGSRAMVSSDGSSYLGYDIYADSGKTMRWGNTNTVKYYAATSAAQTLPVYAYIPEGQQVSDGNYMDVVTVTVVY